MSQIKNENRGDSKYLAISFLLAPFITFLISLFRFKEPWAKNIIWLFIGFYGFSFVISDKGMDAFYYANQLERMHLNQIGLNRLIPIGGTESAYSLDYLQPLITYSVSRFTSDYKILYMVFGLIFGYFYSRNLFQLYNTLSGKEGFSIIFLIVLIALVVPFWSINGVRMWTATHIFLFGIIKYVTTKKWPYLFFLLLAILMHFSFLFPSLLFCLLLLVGKPVRLFFILMLISLVIEQIDLKYFSSLISNYLPGIYQNKISSYTNESYRNLQVELAEKTNWYVKFYITFLKFGVLILLISSYIPYESKIKNNGILKMLFSFSFLFMAMSNFLSSVPSFNRFVIIACLISLVALVFLIDNVIDDRKIRRVLLITSPLFILFIMVSIRVSLDTIGLQTLFGNIVSVLLFGNEVSLISLIK